MFKPKIDRIKCDYCGKEFEDYTSNNRKYCSSTCYFIDSRQGEMRKCVVCGNEFYVVKQRLDKNKNNKFYCSKKCQSFRKPWNKGKTGILTANSGSFKNGEHRSPKTEFKKGYDVTKHWNWKGGITPDTQKIRTSVEYADWRTKVFERDDYTCQWCGVRSGNGKKVVLHADHVKPFAYFPELRLEVSNGRTLCDECHKYTATYMGNAARYFSSPKKFIPRETRIEYGGASLGAEEHDVIMQTVMSQGSKRWTIGPESQAFESELAEVTGVKRAVVVNSGSSALLLAIASLKLEKGSKVIIPAVNFPTAFNAIIQNGLVPYVVDVDPDTLNLSLDEVKIAVSREDIKAVIAVDIAGNPVDLIKLREIVGKEVKIILDNCDGYGCLLNGKFIDTFSDVSCVSFHAAHIITTGEGGAILTDYDKYADVAKSMREWGRASGTDEIYRYPGFPDDYRERYVYEEIGYNLKPLELQCAMGRIQLKKLDKFRELRLSNFNKLEKVFEKYPHFQTMKYLDNSLPCWFSFPFMTKEIHRGKVMDILEENNIECRTIFSGNILKHPAYANTPCLKHNQLKYSDMVMKHGVFISVHPSITDEMIAFIDEVLGSIR